MISGYILKSTCIPVVQLSLCNWIQCHVCPCLMTLRSTTITVLSMLLARRCDGEGLLYSRQHCSPRTDGRTYLDETAGPVTLSGCTWGKERRKVQQQRCQWRGNRVGTGQGGRQQQRGLGLGLKDFLAASGNSEEGIMAVAEISYILGSKDTVTQILFSEVLRLASLCLCQPCSNASLERAFSTLRRLKTWLRNTMGQKI